MSAQLKCFLSVPFQTDSALIRGILASKNIQVNDALDLTIGESFQQILDRKLKEADFAIFVLEKDDPEISYQIGVCDGIGKPYLVLVDASFSAPIYLRNKLLQTANLRDREILQISIEKLVQAIEKFRKPTLKISLKSTKSKKSGHDSDVTEKLQSYLKQVQQLRTDGASRDFELILLNIFKTLNLNYVENISKPGIDFVLWNDELGRVVGNPMIVEATYGDLNINRILEAENRIKKYIEKTDAKLALIIYLDRKLKRYKISRSLHPLIMSYDAEDFVRDLIDRSFEEVILKRRNKIAHGVD